MIQRILYNALWAKLAKENKMVLVSGPRQSGKTTFAQTIALNFTNNLYFNWDRIPDKKRFSEDPSFFQKLDRKDASVPLVILDEIHKYKQWKNYLKGIYDEFSGQYQFLITGSGRLDIAQKAGEALSGRYLPMNLFPFSLSELSEKRKPFAEFLKSPLLDFDLNLLTETKECWERLFHFGPFPEPYVKARNDFLLQWSETYTQQIIREDIRTFFDLRHMDTLELLVSILYKRIGSPLSVSNLASDLQVSFDTIKNWLGILDAFYIIFSIGTWTKKISRAILKEKKVYLFNYTEITDPAIRYENMVALELYKMILLWNQAGLGKFQLCYLRNKEKEEVDFLISDQEIPLLLVEAKWSDENAAKSLIRFQNILKVPAVQLVNRENIYRYIKNGNQQILIVSADRWLSSLPGCE